MKRTIGTAALILLALLSLAACGKKKSEEGASQTGGTDVSAATNVTLPEDGETVAYVLAARMVSDYLGNEAFVPGTETGANTFWATVDYLVSAYGTQNTKISTSEDGLSYEVKLEQLRYYAAALYADLGKAKDLPELSEMTTGVTRKSKKAYIFSMVDTSQYRATINSSVEVDDGYKIGAALVDATSGETVVQYAASVKKSAYTGKKSPFHYAVAELNRMTKRPIVQVLVGPSNDDGQADQSAPEGQAPEGGQTTPGDSAAPNGGDAGTSDGSQASGIPESGGTSSEGGSSSTDGGASAGSTSSATGDPASGSSAAGTEGGSSSADSGADGSSSAGQGTSQPSDGGGTGGGISNGSALAQARDYFGTSDEESGKTYVYSYEGTTTFNGTDYYNFYVTDGESYVTNILVSYDGSRILKGTKNADGSWSLQ
ncbi:MAG: hypothetical protein HFI88_04290 [Lachnospiraceae bacterium]|nr:hypothetical protein [Lachnospiraceae bacterium]